ncbi:MAG: hypothetical protein VX228_08730, partial [Pseudomonadota bacterium]|nr:hypothetical protein [Pseudomonadota bacterium]
RQIRRNLASGHRPAERNKNKTGKCEPYCETLFFTPTLNKGTTPKSLFFQCGAPDRNNLEHAPFISVLDESEEWEAYLKSDPGIVQRLRAFSQAADGIETAQKIDPDPRPGRSRSRGPSL